MKKITALVTAGGFGNFVDGYNAEGNPKLISKVTAKVNGFPMVRLVLENLISTGLFDHFYVVINQVYGTQVQEALSDISHITYVKQVDRVGTAGAVKLALQVMNAEYDDILVTFADMPLWRSETFHRVCIEHRQRQPDLTMVTIPLHKGHKAERYGRVIKDSNGKILRTFEPWELENLTGNEKEEVAEIFARATEVNPSLYVCSRRFLENTIPQLKPISKPDGFPPELLLQHTVPHADLLHEVKIGELEQALGVNTEQELEEVRTIAAHMFPVAVAA